METDHYIGNGSWVSGSEVVHSLPPEQLFVKLLSLGINWAMLIKSPSMQTTVVQTINFTLVTQLIKIVQQFVTTLSYI